MKVLVVPYSYPNKHYRYRAIFIEDQVKAISKITENNIYVLGAVPVSLKEVFSKGFSALGRYEINQDNVSGTILFYLAFPKLRKFNRYMRYILNKFLMNKFMKKYGKMDIIHIHNADAGKIAVWIKKIYGIPYCITEHSSSFNQKLKVSEIKYYQSIYENSSYNIAVSEVFSKTLSNIFQLNFHYIPNVTNTNIFVPKSLKNRDGFRFINVANLTKNKNQKLLIQSFAKVFSNHLDVKLLIIGQGEEYLNLNREIQRLNVSKQVVLYGSANRKEVVSELQKSDILVLSSNSETFGVVIIEAMSCGLPVLSTKSGGPESIIKNEKLGILVEKNDINLLSSALLSIKEKEYDKKYIRKYCIEKFSNIMISNKLNNIYEKMKNEN